MAFLFTSFLSTYSKLVLCAERRGREQGVRGGGLWRQRVRGHADMQGFGRNGRESGKLTVARSLPMRG